MERDRIRTLLAAVADGVVGVDDALSRLASSAVIATPVEVLDGLRLDHHRPLRTGEPEVVYAEGKTPAEVATALQSLLAAGTETVLATRADPEHAAAAQAALDVVTYDERARVLVARRGASLPGTVAVVTAGTSDLPVAAECAAVLDAFGIATESIVDVGVAGIHRLLAVVDRLQDADVVVVVAGMEGALPTAVAALVASPVIAVPTSVGYGAAFDGLAALLGMLTSCAPGVTVVNIDNGFGAALAARRILARTGPGRADATDGALAERSTP